jgi:purine-binding chemotaxis protein CheW
MPPCVRGVINLRGAVVPVVDLLARFGRPSSPVTKRTCVVIVEAACGADERQVMGLLVDAVNEVLDIAATDIEPPPAFGARMRSDFIHGVGKVRGKFVLLLDVDRTLSIDELSGIGAGVEESIESLAA